MLWFTLIVWLANGFSQYSYMYLSAQTAKNLVFFSSWIRTHFIARTIRKYPSLEEFQKPSIDSTTSSLMYWLYFHLLSMSVSIIPGHEFQYWNSVVVSVPLPTIKTTTRGKLFATGKSQIAEDKPISRLCWFMIPSNRVDIELLAGYLMFLAKV